MNMKTFKLFLIFIFVVLSACSNNKTGNDDSIKLAGDETPIQTSGKVIVAYVTSWSDVMPDPTYMTHINYAFGHVNETFNGVGIANEGRLRSIVTMLKDKKSETKILLSIGGWGSGRFSEMAANAKNRKSFAEDCKRVINNYGLDGIDIDWEYPTSAMAGISASPEDTKNFTLMMKDIRNAIGKNKLLTLATAAGAGYIDFKGINPYIDFVNIMSYDMANAPKHHSALYSSENSGNMTGNLAVEAHIAAGIPANKLTLGMPFYGRGGALFQNMGYGQMKNLDEYTEKWDDVAKVPYLVNKDGIFVFGYENPRSLKIKCQYILDKGLLGGMYWDYAGDNENGDLRRTVYECLRSGF
jgi:chitinase